MSKNINESFNDWFGDANVPAALKNAFKEAFIMGWKLAAAQESSRLLPKGSVNTFSIGDIIIVPIKNRWGIDCAATIEAVHADTVDATVWNIDGPGADRLVTGIPQHSVCEVDAKE